MSNKELYDQAFVDTFEVESSQVENLAYQDVDSWDSVGHMQLVAALEDAFDIMMETDDIIDISSYATGKEILKRYDVLI